MGMELLCCSDYVRVLKTSENVQCIWLQCDKKMFGLEEDVIVGAAYINPQSRDTFPVRAVQAHFTDLFEDTLGAFQVSPYVVLCGDFNVVTPTLKWYRKYRSVMSHY